MSWIVGVDIGGTFTDFVIWDEASGQLSSRKRLTTPESPHVAVVEGFKDLVERFGFRTSELRLLSHGTTLATNAILERKGAKVGFITTDGFKDVLIVGREHRYDMQDLLIDLPKPLGNRRDILEVVERTVVSGEVIQRASPEEILETSVQLIDDGVEAIAIGFLHSYQNAENEAVAAEAVRASGVEYVSVSHEVAPVMREYERFSTVVTNAYVQPLLDEYLGMLEGQLAELGVSAPLTVMLSNGGIATPEDARAYPVRLIESGPAAGVMAAAYQASLLNLDLALSFDMGGTTAKGSIIRDGEPQTSFESEVARLERFKAGSGIPLAVPTVDLIEIGAGGGSIATIDEVGRLQVGPQSAGAAPGPACYASGGHEPTVTDADLVLGYLNADLFASGEFSLDKEAAEEAIKSKVAEPLNISVVEAAWGIHSTINQSMASAFRIHAVEQRVDIQACPIIAFGGAGPGHAIALAEALGSPTVIVPYQSSVFSAVGLIETPPSFESMHTYKTSLDAADWAEIKVLFDRMEREGSKRVDRANVRNSDVVVSRSLEMRYVGQQRQVQVDLPKADSIEAITARLHEAFSREYRRRYTQQIEDVPLEIVNLRVKVSGVKVSTLSNEAPKLSDISAGTLQGEVVAPQGEREVWFDESSSVQTPTFLWENLKVGQSLEGPTCIDDESTVVVVRPGWHAQITEGLNIIIRRRHAENE